LKLSYAFLNNYKLCQLLHIIFILKCLTKALDNQAAVSFAPAIFRKKNNSLYIISKMKKEKENQELFTRYKSPAFPVPLDGYCLLGSSPAISAN
jgi:hypothetical protein